MGLYQRVYGSYKTKRLDLKDQNGYLVVRPKCVYFLRCSGFFSQVLLLHIIAELHLFLQLLLRKKEFFM